MIATLVSGKTDLADVFFLIAVILAVIDAVLLITSTPDVTRRSLISLVLAFTAAGLLVL